MRTVFPALTLTTCLLLGSCSYSQFAGITAGGSLGGMFGSSIGGLLGGPRGSDAGTAIGMLAGGALGAAMTAERSAKQESGQTNPDRRSYREKADDIYLDEVQYGYNEEHRNPAAAISPWENLEVTNLRFTDSNNNRTLEAGEQAYVIMDIYNRGDKPVRNVAPLITSDNRRIIISPTAIISSLPPNRGMRYKAALIAGNRLKDGEALFSVSFGEGKQKVTAKHFRIRTARHN